jgi:murein DD-endopeptidase MepM/ murein hydrolase activator NlpD
MIRVFPVAAEGHPIFTDDFGAPRLGARKHQGNDIFADEGTPIVAVDDGALRFDEDPIGAHAFYLNAGDGTVYYGAHLSAFEGPSPRQAVAGEIIGYVGHTGNAATTAPHLHFEVHPSGGIAVDPYRLLLPLPPPSVVSSLGAVGQVLPPSPVPSELPLPPIPVRPGPVAPIPYPTNRGRNGAGVAFFFALLFGGVVAARVRRGAHV